MTEKTVFDNISLLGILDKYGIEYPDIDKIRHMTIEEKNGWGEFRNCRHLSLILK